jgi:ketosteroid isomerase-like protein
VAKLNMEQAITVSEVQQLINDWAHELDVHNGLRISNLITEDCIYSVRGTSLQGRAAVEKFYEGRLQSLSEQATGVPTQRHALSNLRVEFQGKNEVSITFTLVFFTTAGMAAGANPAEPAAVADVRMECRRGGDEEWRIAKFDSNQTLRRVTA